MKCDYRILSGLSLLVGILLLPVPSAAASTPVVNQDNSKAAAASQPTAQKEAEDKSGSQKKDYSKKEKDRYVKILEDNGFVYALDTRNAHWIPMPHSGNEYIADVWVRLVQTDGGDGNYSYPQKYYLEHYYIRPKTQQIQFLSELEVTGRPENAIQERPYKSSNWENLVPDSIEDEIYHKVLQAMKKNRIGGDSSNGMSIRDAVEEYLRISL